MLDSCLTTAPIAAYFLLLIAFRRSSEAQVPSKTDSHRSKTQALRVEGTLNTAPEKVSDPKFLQSDFFDPRDLVQVKYEMLRRVSAENASVTDATDEYGVSRPTYYQAKTNFDEGGSRGWCPRSERLTARTNSMPMCWRLSRSESPRASRSARENWQR